jgi:hypothetical protein
MRQLNEAPTPLPANEPLRAAHTVHIAEITAAPERPQ